jgi:hypothetical protein
MYEAFLLKYNEACRLFIVCKIMESIIEDTLLTHLIQNKLIHKNQHGFVPFKSCTTNLLETIDLLTSALNQNVSVDIILNDLQKAFDTVPHNKLLRKLKMYRISQKRCATRFSSWTNFIYYLYKRFT